MKAKKNKKYGELWSKIRDLIRSRTKNSYDYDRKYMKNYFNPISLERWGEGGVKLPSSRKN